MIREVLFQHSNPMLEVAAHRVKVMRLQKTSAISAGRGRISAHLAESFYSGSGTSLVSDPFLRKLALGLLKKGNFPLAPTH
jgi:hypothetical protein